MCINNSYLTLTLYMCVCRIWLCGFRQSGGGTESCSVPEGQWRAGTDGKGKLGFTPCLTLMEINHGFIIVFWRIDYHLTILTTKKKKKHS